MLKKFSFINDSRQIIIIINVVNHSITEHLIHHSSVDLYITYTSIHVRISTEQCFISSILRTLIKDKTVNKQIKTIQFFRRAQNDQKFQYW